MYYFIILNNLIILSFMKFFLAIDIGGTTFNTGIFTQSFNQIALSNKDKIRNTR